MFYLSESAIRLLFFWGGLAFFLSLELILPYRPSSVSKLKRWANNLGLTLFNSIVISLVFSALIITTTEYVQKNTIGILNMVRAPFWLKVVAVVIIMDFFLYVWHLLNHEMPFLWRFHRVHHSDLNMDVSTATRFHLGELAVSAVIKVALIYILGASALAVLVFETGIVLCAQFHHSSLKVPLWFEKIWWVLFVPPSMHRIHHSVVIKERDSNYGTILSLWDRFLGTMTKDVDQSRIRIGVGAYRKPEKLNLNHLFLMPFKKQIR
jgi:sterol desaturase/sphingolipid hydroxylase (fatty acid hydroxylase superfamily)